MSIENASGRFSRSVRTLMSMEPINACSLRSPNRNGSRSGDLDLQRGLSRHSVLQTCRSYGPEESVLFGCCAEWLQSAVGFAVARLFSDGKGGCLSPPIAPKCRSTTAPVFIVEFAATHDMGEELKKFHGLLKNFGGCLSAMHIIKTEMLSGSLIPFVASDFGMRTTAGSPQVPKRPEKANMLLAPGDTEASENRFKAADAPFTFLSLGNWNQILQAFFVERSVDQYTCEV